MIRDTKRSIQMETSFYDYTDKFQHNNNKNRYHQVQHRTYISQEPSLPFDEVEVQDQENVVSPTKSVVLTMFHITLTLGYPHTTKSDHHPPR